MVWPFKNEEKPIEEESGKGPECAACGQPGADKKYGGQYWHKKCLRKAKKQAKSMF
ncbi:hypothetical protein K8R43_04925 [archaeon]|nr:hypothetical protein [archaeon]